MALAAWLLLTLALSLLPITGPSVVAHQDKFGHFVMYGIGSVLLYRILVGRVAMARTAAIAAAASYGGLIEAAQSLLPYRQASLYDILSNTAGALVFCMVYAGWRKHEA